MYHADPNFFLNQYKDSPKVRAGFICLASTYILRYTPIPIKELAAITQSLEMPFIQHILSTYLIEDPANPNMVALAPYFRVYIDDDITIEIDYNRHDLTINTVKVQPFRQGEIPHVDTDMVFHANFDDEFRCKDLQLFTPGDWEAKLVPLYENALRIEDQEIPN